jgi:hypothetical protein
MHAMDPSSSPSPQPKGPKNTQSLENILSKLGPITNVAFEPFQPEPEQSARAILPPTFPPKPHPFDYFSLFFTRELFQIITTNTNRYANMQRLYIKEERAREWTDLLVDELYVFLGTIIYMGVYDEPQVEIYWNSDFNKGPLHSITNHISLCRFEQIKRYCHISCPENDMRNGYHLPNNKIW